MKTCMCEKTFPFSKHVKLLPLFEYNSHFLELLSCQKCIVYRVFHKNNKNTSKRSPRVADNLRLETLYSSADVVHHVTQC